MVEEFKKYPKIYRVGHEENQEIFKDENDLIYIEEKIDGGNFRFMIKEGKVVIGSRTQQLTSDEGEETNMNKMFKACSDYIRQKIEKDYISGSYIFYGENCVKHTLNYNFDEMPIFLGFDIYNLETNQFLDYDTRSELFETYGLEEVPLLDKLLVKDIGKIDDSIIPKSKYAETSAEGVVFKNYKKQIFAKYVSDKFKEENAIAFGSKSVKYNNEENNNGDFIFKYVTNARIDKHIFRLLEEGHKLEMSLIQHLPKRIYEDIWEENWKDLALSKWKLDLNKIMKPLTKRCVSVLNQVITNNARGT